MNFISNKNPAEPPLGIQMPDGAFAYHETDFSQLIVEPWNAFSSLAIALPAVYFALMLRGQYKRYPFMMACMPLLFIGGMGSTLFHAFRASPYLLMMDWMPIAILVLMISMFMWYKVLGKWWLAIALVLLLSFMRFFVPLYFSFEGHAAINFSYFIGGTTMLLPVLLLSFKTNFTRFHLFVLTTLLLALALFFRYFDNLDDPYLPMGTHWLWHILSGMAAFPLGYYLKYVSELKTEKTQLRPSS